MVLSDSIMETPYLPRAKFGHDFNDVYEPAEDTFLLLDALEKDLDELIKNASICIEFGSGSGTVITALSKSLGTRSKLLIATDINIHACRTTRKCANHHNQKGIEVLNTNLAECLLHNKLDNQVDVLVFNPPYVPTEETETLNNRDCKINLSWAGGKHGRKLIDRFLNQYVVDLLSKPYGVAYLVALEQNNIRELQNLLIDHDIRGSVAIDRQAGAEHLYIIKYEWIVKSDS